MIRLDQKIKSFTVFAPQRSGTNYLQRLLSENFLSLKCDINSQPYVWKHEPNTDTVLEKYKNYPLRETHLHLLVTKNPYKWIESIKRRPVDVAVYRPNVRLVEGLEPRYVLQADMERQFNNTWRVEKLNLLELVNLYNEFYRNWLSMGNKVKFWGIAKYEPLLIPEKRIDFLQSIQDTYNLTRRTRGDWIIPSSVTLSDNWTPSLARVKTQDYLDDSVCNFLNQEQIDVVHKYLDKNILKTMGYPLEKPISVDRN